MVKPPSAPRPRRNLDHSDRRKDEHESPDFRVFVDDAVQGVIIHHNFKPLYVNKAFAELFGYSGVKEMMELLMAAAAFCADIAAALKTRSRF